MFTEFYSAFSTWDRADTWIVLTAMLSAMSCALPGNYLLLKRQSMMGDALSHTALLGVVAAFLTAQLLISFGWMSPESYLAGRALIMLAGAIAVGLLAAVLTEAIEKLGGVEASAALGVVFTTFFALGLFLTRAFADDVHIDPDCVLFGELELVLFDTLGKTGIPWAALINGSVLVCNLLLLMLFYKELCITAFDPAAATTQGIPARAMSYALVAATSVTLVAAFQSVGSILGIAMLIVPAAAASLLTDRLRTMIVLSQVIAALSAVLGHVLSISLPRMVFSRLGLHTVQDVGTAGMMAVAAGGLFTLAFLFAPRRGLVSRLVSRMKMSARIAAEDVLGLLYRSEERAVDETGTPFAQLFAQKLADAPLVMRWALHSLRRAGQLVEDARGLHLTDRGREAAQHLVRSHRLWESYLARHFPLPEDHLHESAERVEHYLSPALRDELAADLDQPGHDPHGRVIPDEK